MRIEYQTEILRFREGVYSPHPSPEASVAAAQPNALSNTGAQIAALVDLIPELPYRSREIRTLVVKTYWTSSGSIVARLRRALVAANRHLIKFNEHTAPGSKCAGNLTCGVFDGEELFLGQVGAAYAYAYHPPSATEESPNTSTFELFPRRDRLLIPLGSVSPPVIHISYTIMSPGSVICLATTQAAEAIAREEWQQILALPELDIISERLRREFSNRQISGAVILVRAAAAPAFGTPPWRRASAHKSVTPTHTAVPPLMKPVALTPIESSERRSLHRRSAVEPLAPTPEVVKQPASVPDETTLGEPTNRAAEKLTQELQAADQGREPSPKEMAIDFPPVSTLSETEKESKVKASRFNILSALTTLRTTMTQISERRREERRIRKLLTTERTTTAEQARLRQALHTLLPGKVGEKRPVARPEPPHEHPSVMGGVVIGIFLLVLLITITEYWQLGGPLKAEALLAEAMQLREQAYTQDPEKWYRILELSTQVVRLDPENAQAQELKEEAQSAVDALENASILNAIPLLELGPAPTPRRLLATKGWLYILKTATDAVVTIPLGEDNLSSSAASQTTILRKGQVFFGEEVMGLVDLAWVDPDNGFFPDGAVFIYSEGGTVFIYEPALGPGDITVQRLQGDLDPGTVTAMATFQARIYLLHRQLNQILTYEPVNGMYDEYRTYFAPGTTPELQLALDMGIDGRVYLLMGDGTIRAYFSGVEDPSFEIGEIPGARFVPHTMAIEPDPDEGLIYLSDPNSERIIVLDKQGNFVRQYRFPGGELRNIEALAVTVAPHRLYFISNGRLYAAQLPTEESVGTAPNAFSGE